MKHVVFKPSGEVCSKEISFDLDNNNNKIYNIKFVGGCPGNLLAISKLLEGAETNYVIEKLKGNKCAFKSTSCADQLVRAIEENMEK